VSEWEKIYGHRKDVEQLQARQYWRPEWKSDVSLTRAFDIGDASTLGTFMAFYLSINSKLGC
jgi:gamma-tubulin complex component 5